MSTQVGQQAGDQLKNDATFVQQKQGQSQVGQKQGQKQRPNAANHQFFPDNVQVVLPEVSDIWDKPVVILKPW